MTLDKPVTANELILIIRHATEKEVHSALCAGKGNGADSSVAGSPADLLAFFNRMLDAIIDEDILAQAKDSLHTAASAHVRNLKGRQLQ